METNTIGSMIGVVAHAFSIKNDHGDQVQISIKVDFTTASMQDIKGWLVSNRIIAGQRPWRALGKDELTELNGQTFTAQDIGRKVKSREERVQTYIAAGIPRKLAEIAIDNPKAFQDAMNGVEVPKNDE